MRYAIISDVHGNAFALKAVLSDIKRRGADKIINLGDHFFGAIQPAETAAIMAGISFAAAIRGNKDRDTVEAIGKTDVPDAMQFVLDALDEPARDFLRNLPETAQIDDVLFACHGTPDDDNTYLTENVAGDGTVTLKSDNELISLLKNVREPIVLCGHSHVQRCMYLSNGQIILNPGSVGLPAYIGAGSPGAIMQSYSPMAKYAIVEKTANGFAIDQISCTYDWQAASALALKHGNADWAGWILSGRALKKKQG
ncbi:MAG: metallophosphoesterase family protein [Mucilaginibacter polytrichastri]|nr:metallophosphoesterase family protein [Mucilaginibacter polytrichastri]